MKQNVAIMDLGTSKITVLIGSRGANNSVCIDGIARCDYAGFCNGAWREPEHVGESIARALTVAMDKAQYRIDKLYVGVPGDFLLCSISDVKISLGRKRKVSDNDIDTLYNQGNTFDYQGWTIVNIEPIYYTLDDERKMVMPVGMSSTRLGGCISYMFARNDFMASIGRVVGAVGIPAVDFIAAPLAEMLFLFDDYRRDNCVMLADVGALSTTLIIGRGDGICRKYHFPWGGKRITLALEEALNISSREAEMLKCKVVLSLDPDYKVKNNTEIGAGGEQSPSDADKFVGIIKTEYAVEIDNEVHTYPVSVVNEVVKSEIRKFALYTEKALKVCDYEYPEFTPLAITGGGLNYIRGAAEWLSTLLSRTVEPLKPNLPMLDIPQLSSALGLLDMVLSSEQEDTSLGGRLRRWLARRG